MKYTYKEVNEIKLPNEAWNDCPKKEDVESRLDHVNPEWCDVIGLDHWQNTEDTIVFATDRYDGENLMNTMQAVYSMGADEVDWVEGENGRFIIRVWWD